MADRAGGRRRAAVIGHPVAHSRSPAMHTAAYRALGLDWEYTAIDVPPAQLDAFIAGLDAGGFAGVNVTIPHKQAVLDLCDELSGDARRAGSVNTVLVRDGRLRGETTDGAGLLWALGPVEPADALVLGAGGAARAAVAALTAAGWRVAVSARRPEAAAELGVAVQPWPPERGGHPGGERHPDRSAGSGAWPHPARSVPHRCLAPVWPCPRSSSARAWSSATWPTGATARRQR